MQGGNLFNVHTVSLIMLNDISQPPLNLYGTKYLYYQDMSIGTRLRQLREANNLSGEQLGEMMGVTKGMVSQWESDMGNPPTTERLLMLHKHINFSLDWLLLDEENVYSTSDPKIIAVCRAMEPQAEYVKDAAASAVLTTCELATRARANGTDR